MKRIASLTLFTLAVACGTEPAQEAAAPDSSTTAVFSNPAKPAGEVEDEQPEGADPVGSFAVRTVHELPACENANDGALAYVKAEDAFMSCEFGKWSVVKVRGKDGKNGKSHGLKVVKVKPGDECESGGVAVIAFDDADEDGELSKDEEAAEPKLICNGDDGAQGLQGEQGAQGDTGVAGADGVNGTNGADGVNGTNGTNGTDNRIVAVYSCSGAFSDPFWSVAGGPAIRQRYSATVYASGDVRATAQYYWDQYVDLSGFPYASNEGIPTETFYSGADAAAESAVVVQNTDFYRPNTSQTSLNEGKTTFTLDRDAETVTAVYDDLDMTITATPRTRTFPLTCVVTEY